MLSRLSSLLLVLATLLVAQGRFEAPACSGDERELADRTFFVLCHSARLKVAVWVSYELKPEHLHRVAARPRHFHRDMELSHAGASNHDYRGSGFSRGHMAPAADFAWSTEAIQTTFLLSNAVPQRQALNSGRWAQLETAVRVVAADSDLTTVITGPIFDNDSPETIGAGRVAVPTHLFKVVLAVRGARKIMYAAIIPNAAVAEPLNHFSVSVAEAQQRTGIDFFSGLEDSEEERLETEHHPFPAVR